MRNQYIIIDRDNMKFLAAAGTLKQADLIAWCDHPDVATVILSLDEKRHFANLTRLEILLLYKNTTGKTGNIWEYAEILTAVYELAQGVTLDQRSIFDLEKKAATLPVTDAPPPPHRPIYVTAEDYPAPRPQNQPITKESAPSPSPSARPSPKGSTGRVWEIADQVKAANPNLDGKGLRSLIISTCEQQGIHPATAATQYSKWKKSKE